MVLDHSLLPPVCRQNCRLFWEVQNSSFRILCIFSRSPKSKPLHSGPAPAALPNSLASL
uniref:Uncharacterized protein n=1 Tax=Anguilla anguilla TaxID=7936 RepID=A0A0E9XCV1_ANGAN